MSETKKQIGPYKNYDYEFLFKINDDIICQRYFGIHSFNRSSLNSLDLKNAIDEIVNIINNDLRSKTRIYLFNTCSTRDNESQEDGNVFKLLCGTRGDGEAVITSWNDFWLVPSDKPSELTPRFNEGSILKVTKEIIHCPKYGNLINIKSNSVDVDGVKTYLHHYKDQFSFSFKYRGKNVITRIWSADDYPLFIRSNVDIANKKVFRQPNESTSNYELRKTIFEGRNDLIYGIIGILIDACSK